MKKSVYSVLLRLVLLVMGLTIFMAGTSEGAVVNAYLKAGVTTKTINGDIITMWGFASCDAAFTTCGAITVPGPNLLAAVGDTLNITVRNDLTGPFTEPVSVVIPGQAAALNPVWIDSAGSVVATGSRPPGDVTSRVRSFNPETPADATTTVMYTWNNVKAGAFVYQSGTHPAVQVQMGLYGLLEVFPATPGWAYSASTSFGVKTTVLYSEIDPALHNAVATGQYGPNPNAPNPPPAGWMTSTVDYIPKYFLINGEPYTAGRAPIPAGVAGQTLLIRFLNAGLKSKVPTLQGNYYMTLIAEDGNLLPFTKEQYELLLPAGKSIDVLMGPTAEGYIPVYDRMLNLTNGAASPGGALAYLQVASAVQNTLTVNKVENGGATGKVEATSKPGGIDCGTVCSASYNQNALLQLTATAGQDSFFTGWTDACLGFGATPTCLVTMDAAKTVTATFDTALPSITVVNPNGGENWRVGYAKMIKWSYTANAGATVNIVLLKGGVPYATIASNVPIGTSGLGSYKWFLRRTLQNGTDYKVQVTSNLAYSDMSDNNFRIISPTPTCTYTVGPLAQSFVYSGGAGTVNVTAPNGCAWTAVSNAAWITINGAGAGTGNGTVNFTVAANTGPARVGTLTVAGQTVTVNQDVAPACTYSINPTSAGVAAAGGAGSVSVTTPGGCNWTAVSNAAWITITGGAAGTGNGTVSYSVAANAGAARTGTMTIAGQTFTVNQLAAGGGGFTVTGKTMTAAGVKIPNVLMTLTGPITMTVISNGEFKFTGVPPGTYTLTPSLAGYTFTPTNRTVTVTNQNVGGQNFIGTPQ